MGSPLSPALCSMVIASLEAVWRRTFEIMVRSIDLHTCFLRYVDNRLLFAPKSFLQLPCVQLLQRMEFYGQDIILEDEQEFDFLGFHVDYPNGCIKYNRSLQDVDLLHPLSAAPKSICCPELSSSKNADIPHHRSKVIFTFFGGSLISDVYRFMMPS